MCQLSQTGQITSVASIKSNISLRINTWLPVLGQTVLKGLSIGWATAHAL